MAVTKSDLDNVELNGELIAQVTTAYITIYYDSH